jgi:hypothetical protein
MTDKAASFWPCRILVNTTRETLLRYGPMVPASMQSLRVGDPGPRIDGFIILDTGAGGMMIDESVAQELQLPVEREWEVHGAHGWGKSKKYFVRLMLPVQPAAGPPEHLGMPIECTGMPDLRARCMKDGIPVLGMLGRNFFQFCHLTIDGPACKIEVVIDESIQRPAPA